MAESKEWASRMGQNWASRTDAMDRQLAPVAEVGLGALAPQPGERIIDLGCGPAATSLLLATAVGITGKVTGLDISPDLLEIARERAADVPQLEFVEADAQTHVYAGAAYDALFSRFGCMFFEDPPAAFRNLHGMLKPGARAVFLVYTDFRDNPWAVLPFEAGNAVLGSVDPPKPGVAGPFGWSTPEIFEPILTAGGFQHISWDVRDLTFEIGDGDMPDARARAVHLLTKIGPLARRLFEAPAETVAAVKADLAARLDPYLAEDWVRMPARIWVVTATS